MHFRTILAPKTDHELVKGSNSRGIRRRKAGKSCNVRVGSELVDHSSDTEDINTGHENEAAKDLGLSLSRAPEPGVKRPDEFHGRINVEPGHNLNNGPEPQVEVITFGIVFLIHTIVVKEGAIV